MPSIQNQVTPGDKQSANSISQRLKQQLLTKIKPGKNISDPTARNKLRAQLQTCLSELLLSRSSELDLNSQFSLSQTDRQELLQAGERFQQRLLDQVIAGVLSEQLAPEICLAIAPLSAKALQAALPGCHNHLLIFADALLFQHEFYPLAVDALVHDLQRYGSTHTNVIAAHIDWLNEKGIPQRLLFYDHTLEGLSEADIHSPIQIDSVQFHSLGINEQQLHQQLAPKYHCTQVNPYKASALADNKAATLVRWAALDLEIPAFKKLPPDDYDMAYQFAETYPDIVVKPNQATEGRDVRYFELRQNNFAFEYNQHLDKCWLQGHALLQERRDGLVFLDPVNASLHNVSLRLNLAFDGQSYQVESGYLQLGVDTEHPSSAGRGGHIVAPQEILNNLVARNSRGRKRIELRSKEWANICVHAVRAASIFEGLLFVGLDILLDLDENDSIIPVFLEANPRPAGMSHCRLLENFPASSETTHGVSLHLWDGLEVLSNKTHCTHFVMHTKKVFLQEST